MFKLTIKTPEQLFTVFIVNWTYSTSFSSISADQFEQVCLLGPTLSIYKRWNKILPQIAAQKKRLWSKAVVPESMFSL